MVWHIFAKDMKRKKTMNGILLAFIILAAMFTASSLSVMVSVFTSPASLCARWMGMYMQRRVTDPAWFSP